MIRFKDVEILNRHRFTERNKESKAFPNKWGCIKKKCIPLKGNCLYLYTPMASYGILRVPQHLHPRHLSAGMTKLWLKDGGDGGPAIDSHSDLGWLTLPRAS